MNQTKVYKNNHNKLKTQIWSRVWAKSKDKVLNEFESKAILQVLQGLRIDAQISTSDHIKYQVRNHVRNLVGFRFRNQIETRVKRLVRD